LSGLETDDSIANYGIFDKKVILEYNKLKETARSFPSLINFLGFKQSSVNVVHSKRLEGNTTYSFSRLLGLTGDVILSNSNKLLKITIKFGLTISFISFSLALYNILAHFSGTIKVKGFTTTVFSIWFIGGVLMLFLGIIGLYIGKIFDEVKERPLYVIKEKTNFN
jgi:polyisoprenyl-phosphate glycosyltransferase